MSVPNFDEIESAEDYKPASLMEPTNFETPEFQPADTSGLLSGAQYEAPAAERFETDTTDVPQYESPESYSPTGGQTVEGRMEGLLDKNSRYMQAARSRAMMTANQRGLLNTSMAAGAGEKAAIESALPIATADARAAHEAGMAGYQGEISGAQQAQRTASDIAVVGEQTRGSAFLQRQDAESKAALAGYDAALKSGLMEQEAVQRAQQAAYDAALKSGLSEQEARQKSILQAEDAVNAYKQEMAQQAGANFRAEMEIQANERIKNLDITSEEKRTFSDRFAELGETYAEQIRLVNSDPNIPAGSKTAITEALRKQYEANVGTLASVYEVGIEWITGGGTTTGTPGTPGEPGAAGEAGAAGLPGTPGVPGSIAPPVGSTAPPPRARPGDNAGVIWEDKDYVYRGIGPNRVKIGVKNPVREAGFR